MHNIFLNPQRYNHNEYKQRLENQFYQTLNDQIANTNKTIFYRAINKNYELDSILDQLSPHLAYYIIKYKTSNHKLPVEPEDGTI